MKNFDWIDWLLFSIAVAVALAFSSWSMFHLATELYTIPVVFAAVISLMFDIGGLFLGRLSDKYAVNGDKNGFVTWATRAFILTAVFLNVAHAYLLGWGIVGMVLLGSASLIAGILFHVFLHYRSVQAKRKAGTYIETLPTAGFLAMLRYRKEWWAMKSLGLQTRIIEATNKIQGTTFDQVPIQAKASVGTPVEAPESKPKKISAPKPTPALEPAMTEEKTKTEFAEVTVKETIPFGFAIPKPEFTATTKRAMAKEAYLAGHTNPELVMQWISEELKQEVDKVTVQKGFSEARKVIQ